MLRLDISRPDCTNPAKGAQYRPCRRKGFNLVEAAIVLGVIGLVIGGIWVAASSVQREIRRTAYAELLLDLRSRVAETWRGMPIPPSGAVLMPLTNTLYPAESLLAVSSMSATDRDKWDWAISSDAHVYKHPAGIYGGVAVFTGSPDTLSYGIGYVDRADCVWLATSAARITPYEGGVYASNPANSNSGRIIIAVGGSYYQYVFDRESPDQAAMATWAAVGCEAGATNVFIFQAGRP